MRPVIDHPQYAQGAGGPQRGAARGREPDRPPRALALILLLGITTLVGCAPLNFNLRDFSFNDEDEPVTPSRMIPGLDRHRSDARRQTGRPRVRRTARVLRKRTTSSGARQRVDCRVRLGRFRQTSGKPAPRSQVRRHRRGIGEALQRLARRSLVQHLGALGQSRRRTPTDLARDPVHRRQRRGTRLAARRRRPARTGLRSHDRQQEHARSQANDFAGAVGRTGAGSPRRRQPHADHPAGRLGISRKHSARSAKPAPDDDDHTQRVPVVRQTTLQRQRSAAQSERRFIRGRPPGSRSSQLRCGRAFGHRESAGAGSTGGPATVSSLSTCSTPGSN